MASLAPGRPKRQVCAQILRQWFNQGQYEARVARGNLRRRLKQPPTPARASWLPQGAMTEVWVYLTLAGEAVAIAHCFRLPDGTIGASGFMDPKWLKIDGQEYVPYARRSGALCPGCSHVHG